MKRMISLVLTTALAAGLAMGCGTGNNDGGETNASVESSENAISLDGTWPEKTIKIGVEVYDTADSSVIAYSEYFDYLSEKYNVEFMMSESIQSPEDELDFAASCQAAGCSGYIGGYNASMETIVETVTGYGMYYWGAERGLDEMFADNEYYLGGFSPLSSNGKGIEENGDYLLGYEMAYALAEAGCTHVAYCNGGASFGITMFVDRQNGFIDGIADAQNEGYEIVFNKDTDIVEGWPGTDAFTAAQSNIITSDYDGIACSFSGMEVWIQPLTQSGKENSVKLTGIGTLNEGTEMMIESGMICSLIYECEEIVFGNAVPMIINAVNGHADLVKGDDGYCALGVARWNIKDMDAFSQVYEKHEAGEYFVTAEDMTQFFPEFNESASKEDFENFYGELTLENVME